MPCAFTSVVKPPRLVLLTLEIPDSEVMKIEIEDLPENWRKKGYFDNVQQWGMNWLKSKSSLAIIVPSVTSADFNILINPEHSKFHFVRIVESRPIGLDDRLI